MSDEIVPDKRIDVAVLTGFLGSGKTTLLNRLIKDPRFADAVVIVNEFGDIAVDHHLVRGVDGRIVLLDGACVCCSVSGALVDALRDLFMGALRRQIKPFKRVLIETSGLADPSAIIFSLRNDPFLSERYVYAGALLVADVRRIAQQLQTQSEAVRQAVLADGVVFSKTDVAQVDDQRAAALALEGVNPGAVVYPVSVGQPLPDALFEPLRKKNSAGSGHLLNGWLSAFSDLSRAGRHPSVSSLSLRFSCWLSRSRFVLGLAALLEKYAPNILRVKGVVGFVGEALPCVVQAVHQELYPIEVLDGWPDGNQGSCLVFIFRDISKEDFEQAACKALLVAKG